MISTYLGYQLYGQNLAQSTTRTAAEPTVSADAAYYKANIGKVKTVDDLVNNFRLLSYATKAFGLSDMSYAKALMKKVLTSDLTSSSSVANSLHDSRYTAFAAAFGFKTDGTLATTAQLQTSSQQATTESLFAANTSLNATDAAAATKNYAAAMKNITSLSQLEANPTALGYVLIAYGIDATKAASTFEQTLESDLSSPTSFVNSQTDSGYLALSKGVSVNADGSAASVQEAQTDANVVATTNAYTAAAASTSAAQTAAATETTYYLSKISSITSASQFTSDPRLVAYVTKAFGLPSTANAASIQQALTSDTTDATSYAVRSPYAGYLAMAKAFTFTTSGTAGTVTQFQTLSQQQQTSKLYTARQTSDSTTAAAATAYYLANIGKVQSVSDLEKDPKLLSYMTTAYGIDPKTSASTIASIMENTNNIATSTANGTLLALKLGFNVDASGNATNPLTSESSANLSSTVNAYIANAKSDTASQAAAKTAAAYYKSTLPNITSVSALLADPKLVAFIKQAYNIPAKVTTATLQQVLTSDVTNPKSVANTMGSNYNQLAAAFDFTSKGLIGHETQIAQSKSQLNAVTNAYIQQTMQDEASAQNPGIGLALYFQANASKVTNAYSILSDTKLTQFFQTLLGLPATASSADIDSQAKTITNNFNLADLKDPTKVSALIQRFSVLYDLNPPASTAPYTSSSILTGGTTTLDTTSLFGTSTSGTTTFNATTAAFG